MVHRQGLGKTRHIQIEYLWVQRAVSKGKLGVVKVGTNANPADLMTKHLRAEVANAHLDTLRFYVSTGRAASAPDLLACSQSGVDDVGGPEAAQTCSRDSAASHALRCSLQ